MHFRHPLRCPRLNLAENGVAVDVEVVVEVPEIEDDVKSNKNARQIRILIEKPAKT